MTETIYQQPVTETAQHPLPSAPAASREDQMSLATIEAGIREAMTDVEAKVRTIVDEHLPQLADAAAEAENDPIAQALESVFLDDSEKTLIASLISKLGTAAKDVAESDSPAPEVPAEPGAPAEVPQPVASGPSVGGTAT
jgi:hypothetical protein